ncbi:hypothetical protein [Oceanobacillus sp. Castelsardo]|nr:hypothetical protein [Oceanobacillus sp. Castelsardo]
MNTVKERLLKIIDEAHIWRGFAYTCENYIDLETRNLKKKMSRNE